MSDIQIIDNLLPNGYANQIEEDVLRREFPWYRVDDVTYNGYGTNNGFVHLAYNFGQQPSEWFAFIKPIIYNIEQASGHTIDQLLRIRVGLLNPSVNTDYKCNTPHVDFTMPHYTACYYVSDSDGDTILFDQKLKFGPDINVTNEYLAEYTQSTEFTEAARSSPKKNRLCIFDGLRFHSSTKPKEHDNRLVITVNYIGKQ